MLLPADSNADLVVPAAPPTRHRRAPALRKAAAARARAEAAPEASQWLDAPEDRARRLLNVAIASIMLLFMFPVMVLIGIVIKLTSAGPILYTQARVGVDRRGRVEGVPDGRRVVDYGGRLFRIYKFRTMHVRADGGSQTWAVEGDPRVTRVGRILRKLRLDELPQLFNVLAGDMNLVGPRPEQPRIFALLRDQIEDYEARQRVLPGITGWAQVNQNYDRNTDDVRRKVGFDLEYIRRQSWFEDVKILLRTIPAVLLKRGGW
jgi:lipopolysaccharide/colanic/teichoic acid biosynthesis glycosyltransferase